MKRTATVVVLTVLVTFGVVFLSAVLLARSGSVNVAATQDYLPGVYWFFDTLSEKSIQKQTQKAVEAGHLREPATVPDSMLRKGASEYQAMCVPCHGAPGQERGEFGKGMKPQPPDLAHTAREMHLREIYWVLDHGIRHTGMPAFGPTHADEDLWAVAAFVKRLGDMSPEEYRRWVGDSSSSSGHDH